MNTEQLLSITREHRIAVAAYAAALENIFATMAEIEKKEGAE